MNAPPSGIVDIAIQGGRWSRCSKSNRGAAIWRHAPSPVGFDVVSVGLNAPALGDCDDSDRCHRECGRACIHAEQRCLLNALDIGASVVGCEMLHAKVVDGEPVEGGPPSCAECSKLILAAGIAGMWLLEIGRGWVRRTAEDFHRETLENLRARDGGPR